MAVQFLLVLFFETKYDLNRAGVHRGLPRFGTNNAGGVLEDVRGNRLAVDGVFGDAFLVATHLCGTSDADMKGRVFFSAYKIEDLQGPFIHFAPAVGNDANDDFLPAIRTPRFGSVATAEVSNVLENSVVGYQHQFG